MEIIIFMSGIIIVLFGFFIKGFYDQKKTIKSFRQKLKENYGKYPEKNYKPEQYENIAKYYLKHKKGYSIDDITWNDLDMDTIFMLMNHTNSSAGEEYLYHRLRTPELNGDKIERDEELIQYFMDHEEDRIKLQLAFSKMGNTGKYSIYDYLEFLDVLGSRDNAKHIVADILYLPAIVFTLFMPAYGIMFLIALMIYNMLTYSKEKSEIQPYIISFFYVLRVIKSVGEISKLNIDILKPNCDSLNGLRRVFKNFEKRSKKLAKDDSNADPLAIFALYFKMITHSDIIIFNNIYIDVKKHVKDIDTILTETGYLESIIAIGAFRKSIGDYCLPKFNHNGLLEAKNLYHPMIMKPVKNSFSCNRGMLLTGSNASGKSTFLKTIAINAILAQTIHTCMADEFHSEFYRVYSSMALTDNLDGGDSYYIVEIKSLKRILDAVALDHSAPVLCFVDEVLRGTNTVERIAASTQILRSLTGERVKCFAATHDIELTHLLEEQYDNNHFEEEVIEGDVVFHYELLNGRATTRNAIKLLSIIGYNENIIASAEGLAEKFLKTGQWV